MNIINSIQDYRIWKNKISSTVGFIPTMGALHDGHISLIKKSQSLCEYTVVSIFINPLQFSQNEDFSSYPKTIEADLNI